MEASFILYLLAALLVVLGVIGVILPALPGVPLVFAGLLLASWADGFARVGWIPLLILGVCTLASFLIDIFSTTLGAQRMGASVKALWGAALGTLAGLFFFPLGLIIGPFAGAMLGEYLHGRQLGRSAKVGAATWIGIMLGVVFKLALCMAMIGLFAAAWFF